MGTSRSDRTTNLFGALALVADDKIRRATETAARHTDAAPGALVALYEFLGGRSIDDLRHAVGLTSSGAVRLVDRLVAAGYVERRAGADRRAVALALTNTGRRAARRVLEARAGAIDHMLSPLTNGERAALATLMEKLLGATTRERLADRAAGHVAENGYTCRMCDFSACGRERGLCPVANAENGRPRHQVS